MIFFIENKKYNISKDELEARLISDSGNEGNVYEFKDRAVKLYRNNCFKQRLDESTVELLKKLSTTRIKLPRETTYNEAGEFNGYTTELVRRQNKESYFKLLTMKKLIEEIKKYEQDIKVLADRKICIGDFSLDNIEVNNGVHFIDPGSFIKLDEDKNRIQGYNNEEIKKFFLKTMADTARMSQKSKRDFITHFDYDPSLSDMLEYESIDKTEKVSTFVRKLVNKG